MFSLIISIIAIALVAALAAASVYYGGSAFNKGTAGADASTFVNNGQQINGAYTLSATDGNDVSTKTVADMVTDGYLSQAPTYKGLDFTLSGDYVTVNVTPLVCDEIVTKRGGENAADTTAMDTAGALYGCDLTNTADADTVPAFYKVK